MIDQSVLHEKALAAILSGKLPAHRPERAWGGTGTGAPCAVCEMPVTKSELEHEFEMQVMSGVDNPSLTLHIHIRCLAVWDFARGIVTGPETSGCHAMN